MPRGSAGTPSPSASPPLPMRCSGGVPHPTLPDTPGLAAAPSPPRDGSATTVKAPEPPPPLARGKMGSPRDPLFPPGALEGLGAEDPGILHPLCSQLVGLKRMSTGRGWEKAARANDASWDRTRGILFSCGAAGRQEAPPTAHGTQPPPARGPAGERWAPARRTARAPLPTVSPGRCQHRSPHDPRETESGDCREQHQQRASPESPLTLPRPRCVPARGRQQPRGHPSSCRTKPQLSGAGRGSSSLRPSPATGSNPLLCHLAGLLSGGPIPQGRAGSCSLCRAGVKPSSRSSRQSQVLSPGASTEPGQPWGTPCPASRSPVSPKAAPGGAQNGCGTTQPAEARGLHQTQGAQGHLLPRVPRATSTPGSPCSAAEGSMDTPFFLLGDWSCYSQGCAQPGGPEEGLEPSLETGKERKTESKIIHLLRADGSLNKCPFSIGKLPQGMVLCEEKQQGYLGGKGGGKQGGTAPQDGG